MPASHNRGLGTRLRHLLELLDGDVQASYAAAQLDGYRPRFTPVVRAIEALGPSTIKDIAAHAGVTHSAASQTIVQMQRAGWATANVGSDARTRLVSLSNRTAAALPQLREHWAATTSAADALDAELEHGLIQHVDAAIAALERRPFRERIAGLARPALSRQHRPARKRQP